MTKIISRPRILVTRKILPRGLEVLQSRQDWDIDYWDQEIPMPPQELKMRLRPCSGVLSMVNDQLSKDILQECPKLSVIANHAVGLDNIDLDYAKERQINVGNTPDVLTQATAEIAVMLMLMVLRGAYKSAQKVQQGKWQSWSPTLELGADVSGKKLGIVGMGRIGKRVAHMCHFAFDMPIFYHTTSGTKELPFSATPLSLEELLGTCDIISLHCDLNSTTKNLINSQRLALIKATSILINTTRGAVVDQSALLLALKGGKLRAAGLDVTTPEPLSLDSPLLGIDNLIILPHIGSQTIETRSKMSALAARYLVENIK